MRGEGTSLGAIVALVVVVGLAAAAGAFDLFDYDLGLARATGRWILEHHAVPTSNVFSTIHADHPFVDDKWLFHVFAYAAVDGLSPAIAVILRMLLLAATFATLLPRRTASAIDHACAATVIVVAIVCAHERFAFRPELFTMLFLALLWRRLREDDALTRKDFALLLAMQLLWTNLHGYFVLGPIVAAAAVTGRLVDRLVHRIELSDLRARVALPALLVGVGLVNPYGVKLLLSPLHILADLKGYEDVFKQTIVEFVPPFSYFERLSSDLVAYRVLLGLLGCAGLLAIVFARRALRFSDLVPLGVFFAMSLDLRRNTAPFAIVAAPIVGTWLAATIRERSGSDRVAPVVLVFTASCALALGFLFCSNRIAVYDRLDRTTGLAESTIANPTEEVEFVKAHLPIDGMFNSFTFGSYFVGRAFPERKPFIDGNTAGYPPEFLREYQQIVTGAIEPSAAVAKYDIRYFLIRPGHPLTQKLLADDRYVPVFLGRHAVVVVVRDRVDAAIVRDFDLRLALRNGTYKPVVATPISTPTCATFPVAEMNRARLEFALKLNERAESTLLRAIAINADAYEAWHLLGFIRFSRHALAAARDAFDHAIEIAPGFAEAYADRALVLGSMHQRALALQDLDRAVELRGEDDNLKKRRTMLGD